MTETTNCVFCATSETASRYNGALGLICDRCWYELPLRLRRFWWKEVVNYGSRCPTDRDLADFINVVKQDENNRNAPANPVAAENTN